MGLMTEPAWDSNPGPLSSTDYHQENLRHLKKLQARAKQRQGGDSRGSSSRQQPVKAFAMPDSTQQTTNSQKFGPVQPRLYDWTLNGGGPNPAGLPSANGHAPTISNGRISPVVSKKQNYSHVQSRVHEWSEASGGGEPDPVKNGKSFLKGHQKTGPFVPSSAGSVVGGVRRINGLRSKVHQDFGSEYDEVIDAAMAPPSLAGTRFSDVSIDERKKRISNIISEIYSVVPLCKENVTHKTLQKNLRRVASCDQVSDVGSIRAGSTRPEVSRYKSSPKLNGQLSRAPSSTMISVHNVEPLTRAHLKKHDARVSNQEPRHSPTLAPTVSKSSLRHRSNSRHRERSLSPVRHIQDLAVSRQGSGRPSRSATPNYLNDDGQSVIARGVDVDYINANVESVSTVGHNRRNEMKAASDASKVTKTSLILPDTYKSGSVPKYLKNRQMEWKDEEERKEREKPDPDCPPNHVKLTEESRLDTLDELKTSYSVLLQELSRFSVRADSVRIRQRKRDIEDEMRDIEAKIKVYERPKVFVPKPVDL